METDAIGEPVRRETPQVAFLKVQGD